MVCVLAEMCAWTPGAYKTKVNLMRKAKHAKKKLVTLMTAAFVFLRVSSTGAIVAAW